MHVKAVKTGAAAPALSFRWASPRLLALGLLALGVFACSTSVLMIKASALHPAVLSAGRLLLAALLLAPLFVRALQAYRHSATHYTRRHFARSVLPGLTLGLHFISWAHGAQTTNAANASLIVNMVPLVMPVLLFFMTGEAASRREIIGTALGMSGVLVLAGGDFLLSPDSLRGDAICFVSMIVLSFYMAQGRRNRDFPDIWLYLVPLYGVAGVFCLLAALVAARPLAALSLREAALVLGLAVMPTIIGHSCINYALRHLSGQVVSIFMLSQFLFAGVLAYLLWGEAPAAAFYAAGALTVAGAVVALRPGAQPAKG